MQSNPTINNDAPITGGETAIVIQETQIRQVIRQKTDIANYINYIRAAESRYFPNRTQLYDEYTHSLLDGHLFGIIEKRIGAVLNKPLFYKDATGKTIDALTPVVQSYEFRQIIRGILESVIWGITGLEFIPGNTIEVRSIPRKHIKTKTQLITFEQNSITGGIDYTKLDNVWIIGEDDDLGILLPATLYAIYKRNALADWANFIQIFGMPMRIAKYDVNDKATQTALKDALDRSGSALSLLIPKTAEFTIEDGKTSNANGQLQDTFLAKMDEIMSIIVLGNTETTTNGKTGSQAKSKVHQEQQNEILKSDMALVQAYLNDPHFTRILQSYGLPVSETGNFEYNKDVDIAFLKDRAAVDSALVKAGVPIGVSYFYETYNLPVPKTGEQIVGRPITPHQEPDGDETIPQEPDGDETQTPALAPAPAPVSAPNKHNGTPLNTSLSDAGIDYDHLTNILIAKLKDADFFADAS